MVTRDVVFRDRYGLHPRAANRIRETLASFGSKVTLEDLTSGSAPVDPGSMLAVISAGIRAGDSVRLAAEGPDAAETVRALGDLLEAGVCHP